eukprot:COSAG06_NODE_258_length_18940_cov_15.039648_18_plen_69_part_00
MAAAQSCMLESVTDSNMQDWAAALSPGNDHLGGGVPRKRPTRPQWPHTPETAMRVGGFAENRHSTDLC